MLNWNYITILLKIKIKIDRWQKIVYNVFVDLSNDSTIKVNKPSKILNEPEFSNDTDKIRSILNKFEDKDFIRGIKSEDDTDNKDINIYIGSESEFDPDVAIIKTNYNINGEEGTIALIGPKRMEYDRVTALLNYIKNNIE